MWFQQDDATARNARTSMEVVRRKFSGHVISHFGDIPWPPPFQDLSTFDFFVLEYLMAEFTQTNYAQFKH